MEIERVREMTEKKFVRVAWRRVFEDSESAEHPQRHLIRFFLADVSHLLRVDLGQYIVEDLHIVRESCFHVSSSSTLRGTREERKRQNLKDLVVFQGIEGDEIIGTIEGRLVQDRNNRLQLFTHDISV